MIVSLIKKRAERGVSLRRFSWLMLFLSAIIMAILLYTTISTVRAFDALSDATGDYIELAAAADDLMDASDYLTEEVQRYTVIGDRTHLENYFREAEGERRREHALAVMFKNAPNSPALAQLQSAMNESMDLMSREHYAMRLMLDASGDTDIPAALQKVELTEEDKALSGEEKTNKAQLLTHDADYYAQKDSFSPTQSSHHQVNYDKFASLLSYMDEHYADDFTLDEAADFVGFSKYHFTRLFREYTGTTFLDYLTHKRVQAAQSLLASDLSVTEICFRTGFNNLTSFSRSFKKYTGMSPSDFRALSESYQDHISLFTEFRDGA